MMFMPRLLNFLKSQPRRISLRGQPFETYFFYALSALVILGVLLADTSFFFRSWYRLGKISVVEFALGGVYFFYAYNFLWLYLLLKISIAFIYPAAARLDRRLLKSAGYVFLGIGLAGASQGFLLAALSRIPAERVLAASQSLMAWDHALFGVYPPFWLQQLAHYPFIDYLLVFSYRLLGSLLSFLFIALLVSDKALFRKFLFCFFGAAMLSMPLWYAWPAVSPHEMYRENIFALSGEPLLAHEVSPGVVRYLETLRYTISSPAESVFYITEFPSMHAAWGLMILYFGVRLWKPLGVFLVPWFLFNTVGTVYTLMHYAVDALGGVVIMLIVILLVEYMLKFERGERYAGRQPFLILDTLRDDRRKAFMFLRRRARRLGSVWPFGRVRPSS